MRICICRSSENDLWSRGSNRFVNCSCGDSIPPTTARHSCCFTGGNDHDKLADTETLHVNNVRRPGVRLVHLANIQEDWFRFLAGNLLWGWSGKEV
jgi:hypothetical protein